MEPRRRRSGAMELPACSAISERSTPCTYLFLIWRQTQFTNHLTGTLCLQYLNNKYNPIVLYFMRRWKSLDIICDSKYGKRLEPRRRRSGAKDLPACQAMSERTNGARQRGTAKSATARFSGGYRRRFYRSCTSSFSAIDCRHGSFAINCFIFSEI